MRATAIADQQAVALCVVACAFRSLADTNEAAISLLAMTGGDALGDDRRLRVAAEMNHLGAGVGLLMMMGEGDRIEFADRVIAAQRSEERSVGKECVSKCRSRGWPDH